MTDPRRTIHVSGVQCRWCRRPYAPHRLCTQSPTPEVTACMPESEAEEPRVDRDAETMTPCPLSGPVCPACGAEQPGPHDPVPTSVRASWRARGAT